MKYIAYNNDGSFSGWYDSEFHGDNIPIQVLPLTDDDYYSYYEVQASGKVLKVENKTVTINDPIIPDVTWDQIKNIRTALLTACDWTQTLDAPISPDEQKEWQAYRSTLRNLPEMYNLATGVVWPTAPTS